MQENEGTAMHRLCGTLMKWLSWVKQGVKVYGIVILVIRFSIPVEVGMASRVIMSTVNNRDRAEQIARVLLDSRLVACANINGPIVSLDHCQDAIARDEEYLLLMKTMTSDENALIERFRERHPYEVPEVIVLPISNGSLS
jgi:periplasmic divalent cation tolerance protein